MRQAFFLLYLVIFINIHIYASEVKGSKIVLASFSAFDEAQGALEVLGARLGDEEAFLEKQYHFEIVARPSGDVFIIAIEPLKSQKSADLVLKHFKKFYPDAYSADYFGPTKESVAWKSKEISQESIKSNVLQNNQSKSALAENLTAAEEAKSSAPIVRYSWEWIVMLFLVLISIVGVFFVRRGKRGIGSMMHTDEIHSQDGGAYTNDAHKSAIAKIQSRGRDDLSILSLWSYDEALKRSGGNEALLNDLIQSFIKDAPLMICDLKELVAQGDFINIQLRARLLKSVSANIVASALRVMSKRLELAAKEQNSILVESNFFECERIMNDMLSCLCKSLTHDDVAMKKPCGGTLQEVSMRLERLRHDLEKSIFVDVDALKIFGEYADSASTALMGELKRSIVKLEYDKALQIIQSIGKGLK